MPHPEFRIEPLRRTDFGAVRRLWLQTRGVGLNESDTNANMAAYLKRNPGMSFVARAGQRIVGAVLCGHDGRRGYLHHLAVAATHRRRGIARGLLEACFARLGRAGITRCNIYRFSDNATGEKFWLHNGWRKRADLCVLQKAVR